MRRFVLIVFVLFLIVLSVDLYTKNSLMSYISKIPNLNLKSFDFCDDNEFVVLENDINEVVDCLGVEIVNKYVINNNLYIEGYVGSLNKSVNVNGVKTNIQLSQNDNVVFVGYPLIKKSF